MTIQELRADSILDKLVNSNEFSGLNAELLQTFIPGLVTLVGLTFILIIVKKILAFRKSFNEKSILLELTPPAMTEKTAYTTQQLFSVIHNLGKQRSFVDKMLGKKTLFACEIVSSQNQGIRYLLRTTPDLVNNLKRSLISYLPQVNVKTVNEYLPKTENFHTKVIEFGLTKHFAYPLQRQDILIEHDPVAYITGMMTKLAPGELISLQKVLTPTDKKVTSFIKHKILRGEDVLGYISQLSSSSLVALLIFPLKVLQFLLGIIGYTLRTVLNDFADAKMSQRQAQGQYLA